EFEDRQQVKREQQVMHARNKVKVYAVLMALLWAGAIPINVIVARQNPWAVLVIAGTGLALLIYWLRVGGQVSFSRPRPLRFHVGSRIRAAKGTAAGPADCDLTSMQSVTAAASERVNVELTVTRGPFGANNIVCGPAQACLISVTQATPSPTQEADTPINFGLSSFDRQRLSCGIERLALTIAPTTVAYMTIGASPAVRRLPCRRSR